MHELHSGFILQQGSSTPYMYNKICLETSWSLHLFSPLGKLAGRAIYFTDVFAEYFKGTETPQSSR